MQVEGDFWGSGYARIRGLISPELISHLLTVVSDRFDEAPLEQRPSETYVTKLPAVQLSSSRYLPLEAFLWGLTPTISHLVGKRLLPTYCFFRAYREGDTCFVHSDRPACEVSLSLTLAYSDNKTWPLDVGHDRVVEERPTRETFESDAYSAVDMNPGDAVLYQGPKYRHGRVLPNPNAWSAHLFMHWVDGDGPSRDLAFEKHRVVREVNFGADRPTVVMSPFFTS